MNTTLLSFPRMYTACCDISTGSNACIITVDGTAGILNRRPRIVAENLRQYTTNRHCSRQSANSGDTRQQNNPCPQVFVSVSPPLGFLGPSVIVRLLCHKDDCCDAYYLDSPLILNEAPNCDVYPHNTAGSHTHPDD